jgi:putative Mn2+ efflux pump MntP
LSLIEIIAVAFALSMDAFAVSIAAGVTLRRISSRQTFRLAWHFGLFQSWMPIGYASLMGGVVLLIIGVRILNEHGVF